MIIIITKTKMIIITIIIIMIILMIMLMIVIMIIIKIIIIVIIIYVCDITQFTCGMILFSFPPITMRRVLNTMVNFNHCVRPGSPQFDRHYL